jgi:hypothetical protein
MHTKGMKVSNMLLLSVFKLAESYQERMPGDALHKVTRITNFLVHSENKKYAYKRDEGVQYVGPVCIQISRKLPGTYAGGKPKI